MPNDAAKAKSDQPIKNGTSIVTCNRLGNYSTIDTYASPLPSISGFQTKFQDRFDDPSYYYGNATQGS